MIEEIKNLSDLNVENSFTIGQGVTFVGSITADGKAFINGQVTGEITVDDLQVGANGVIKGKITSREMAIHGEVYDHIFCDQHVFVHATGLINGRLIYGELEIEKGGRVNGVVNKGNRS